MRKTISYLYVIMTLPLLVTSSSAADKAPTSKGKLVPLAELGLPRYVAPASYHEDLVIHGPEGTFTMKRSVDGKRVRTDMEMKDQDMTMIELGDDRGTTVTLMPKEMRGTKMSRAGAEEDLAKLGKKAPKVDTAATPPDMRAEDLGDETLDGVAVKKVRIVSEGADVIGWFDKKSGAPLKMESVVDGKKSEIEWKNRKAGDQPAELFEIPHDYQVMDMDEMRKQMAAMGAMGGMAKGMAGGMAQNMGSSLGGSLGGTIGGSLGGPLGAAAGQFIGGKIGGMLGKKAAGAVTH